MRQETRGETYYQLTHDYLVPPIRRWLIRTQRETGRGRAELLLAETTAFWRDRPGPRRLPSLLEWLSILGFARRSVWSADEQKMMRSATRHYLIRTAAAVLIGVALGLWAGAARDHERAKDWFGRVQVAHYNNVPELLLEFAGHREAIRPKLEDLENDAKTNPQQRQLVVVLLYHDRPTPDRAAALRARLTAAPPAEVVVLSGALAAHPEHAGIVEFHRVLRDDSAEPGARLRAACVLSAIEPGFDRGPDATAAASLLAEALLTEPRETHPLWFKMLGPAARFLARPIGEICCDPSRDPTIQAPAAALLLVAQEAGYIDGAIGFLHEVLAERVNDPQVELDKDAVAARLAIAGITLASLGEPEPLWRLLIPSSDPRLRSLLIQRLAGGRVPAHILLDRLTSVNVAPIERQAHLLAWAEAHRLGLSAVTETAVVEAARTLYLQDPHPGVHSAAELLLRRWRGTHYLADCEEHLTSPRVAPHGLRWEPGPNKHTFAILPAPLEFRMGSPEYEPGATPMRRSCTIAGSSDRWP